MPVRATLTFGFSDGTTDVPTPDHITSITDAIDHAAINGLLLWVHFDPWLLADIKSRGASMYTIANRHLRSMQQVRKRAESRVYYRFG